MPEIAPHEPTQTVLLHDHMDASETLLPVLPHLFRLSGREFPFDRENYAEEVAALFRNAQVDIVKIFSNTTGVMQSPETITLAAEAYVLGRARQGFEYCEATIAPQYHVPLPSGRKHFPDLFRKNRKQAEAGIREVVKALTKGFKLGEAAYPNFEANFLFTFGREIDPDTAVFLIETAADCDRSYLAGVGLVCDEAAYPPERHKTAFALAKKFGFKISIHAGEWVHRGREKPCWERDKPKLLRNIKTAIFDLGADRIGHAIPLAYDEKLMEYVVQNRIGVEFCPGSNLASGLIPNTGHLKIRELLQAGVLCSINPDDDLFLPDYFETMELCDKEYHFTAAELEQFNRNAWLTRFSKRKHKLPTVWD